MDSATQQALDDLALDERRLLNIQNEAIWVGSRSLRPSVKETLRVVAEMTGLEARRLHRASVALALRITVPAEKETIR
jgi:hypothetical protein